MKGDSGIYSITNIQNGKKYIGQTQDLSNREKVHFVRLKGGYHENRKLQNAVNKYGLENFKFEILERCDVELLDERECYYIDFYDSLNNGYNLNIGGGSCRGYKHTPEEIHKMRQIQHPKAVLQLDKDFNIVHEWESSSHAAKTLGFAKRGIEAVCKRVNRQKTIGGFIWVYKEEYDNNTIDWNYFINYNRSMPIGVVQLSSNLEFIALFDSVYEASKHTKISHTCISNCVNHKKGRKTAGGYIWLKLEEYEHTIIQK